MTYEKSGRNEFEDDFRFEFEVDFFSHFVAGRRNSFADLDHCFTLPTVEILNSDESVRWFCAELEAIRTGFFERFNSAGNH